MDTLWIRTLEALKTRVDSKNFAAWLQPLTQIQVNKTYLRLAAPNKMVRKWFIENYLAIATDALRNIAGREILIEVELSESQMTFDQKVFAAPIKTDPTEIKKTNNNLPNESYTFDNFIVGPSNEFAYSASLNVTKSPGQGMNPLFIYGGTGLGKTHLLNAVGVKLLKKHNDMRLMLVSAEKFMNELISAIQGKRTTAFHKKYRNLDALLIDDVQIIGGKTATQEEFFHTFNALYENGAQIVLASDKYPREIPMLEERLRSRFGMGMIADIQAPELETRMAIVRKKAAWENITLSDEVAFYIASHITSNIRELEGALRRVAAFAELYNGQISLEVARKALRNLVGDPDRPIGVEQVQKAVCELFNVKQAELIGTRKHKAVAEPRQVAMYLSRKLTNSSFPDIAKKFGNRDHTTVMYACRKVEDQARQDPTLFGMLETLEKTLRN